MTEERQSLLPALVDVSRRYPGRAAVVVILSIFTSLAEGVGILSLFPLLSVLQDKSATGGLAGLVDRALDVVGLQPTIGTLLLVISVGMAVKGALSLVSLAVAVAVAGAAGAQVATDLRLGYIGALLSAKWAHFTAQPVGALTNTVSSETGRASQLFGLGCTILANALHAAVHVALSLSLRRWWRSARSPPPQRCGSGFEGSCRPPARRAGARRAANGHDDPRHLPSARSGRGRRRGRTHDHPSGPGSALH